MSKTFAWIICCLPVLWSGTARATDILAEPPLMPLDERGQAWDQAAVTVSGQGELKIRNHAANIPVDVSYSGTISCRVEMHASADGRNRLEVTAENTGHEIEAKTRTGSIEITDCTVTGNDGSTTSVPHAAFIGNSRVKVDIEGFHTDAGGARVFSEYETEGKSEDGMDNKVKLELENGTIDSTPDNAQPCIPPCGSVGGAIII